MQQHTFLNNDQLKKIAPAIFQQRKLGRLSERYFRVSTVDAIEALAKGGWRPVGAEQKKARRAVEKDFAKHMIRFRHAKSDALFKGGNNAVGQAFPEIILLNSHNGSSCYRLVAGIFVLACSNGLVVAEQTLGSVTVRHTKENASLLVEAADKISKNMKPIVSRVGDMRKMVMNEKQKNEFARAALKVKFPKGGSPFTAKDLLVTRRKEDDRKDLWAVFNVVQENLMAGGLVGKTASGRRFTSSPVRDINVKINANQALWALADDFLARKN